MTNLTDGKMNTEIQNKLKKLRSRARRHEAKREWTRDYPDSPMLDKDFSMKPAVRVALERFRDAKPLSAESMVEFAQKVQTLYNDLSDAYDIPAPEVRTGASIHSNSGSSRYDRRSHTIELKGRKSILTALHEFTHARGYGETGAVWWSANAFRLIWPQSFAKLRNDEGTHVLRTGGQGPTGAELVSALFPVVLDEQRSGITSERFRILENGRTLDETVAGIFEQANTQREADREAALDELEIEALVLR